MARPARWRSVIPRPGRGLGGHLKHEEDEALALIDTYATPELLARFGAEHSIRIGDGASVYVPWLVDGAPAGITASVLSRLPEPVRLAYPEWQRQYADLNLWVAH